MPAPLVLGGAAARAGGRALLRAAGSGGNRGGGGVAINVTISRQSRTTIARMVDGRAVRFAEREALNGTIGAVQRTALKEVAEEMGVTRTALKKRGRTVNQRARRGGKVGALPTRKASLRNLRATLQGFGRPFNLTRFNAQEVRGGARSSLKNQRTRKGRGRAIGVVHEAWDRRQVAMGAFVLNVPGKPVVVPKGKKLRGAYGPGVTHVMNYPHITRALTREAHSEFPRRFRERLRYAFSRGSHLR